MLAHYIDLLRQFWKSIFLVAFGAGALACVVSLALLETMPRYESSVTMNMEPSEEALRFNRAFLGVSQFNPATIITQTHIERLLSRRVAERALDLLLAETDGDLQKDAPNELDRLKAAVWRAWNVLNYGYFEPPSEREELLNALMEATDAQAVLGSYILQLEVTYDDPALAARIANAVARAYTEIASEDFSEEAARVDAALADVQAGKEQELARLTERRRELDRELGFDSLNNRRAILLAERTEARQSIEDSARYIQALQEQLAGTDEAETEASAGLREDISAADRRVTRSAEDLERVEAELQALDRTETELAGIDQRIGEAESDLAELQRQRITAQLARNARLNQMGVISEAVVPTYPSFPKVLVNTVVATLLGALLAIAPIAVLDVLGSRVRTTEDLRQAVGAKALPTVSRRLVTRARRYLRSGRNPGRRLKGYAETLGRRFLTEGQRRWPDARIYVTAIDTAEDVARLVAVTEAAIRVIGQGRPEDDIAPKVVALPVVSQLSDLSSYRDGPLLIGLAAGRVERDEIAQVATAASEPDGRSAVLWTVLV